MAKTKLTEEMVSNAEKAFALGLSNKAVADYLGISEVSFYEYYNRGEKDSAESKDTVFAKFFKCFKKGKADFRIFHMAKIRQAAESGAWQASAWMLERCVPEEFGQRQEVNLGEARITVVNDVPPKK